MSACLSVLHLIHQMQQMRVFSHLWVQLKSSRFCGGRTSILVLAHSYYGKHRSPRGACSAIGLFLHLVSMCSKLAATWVISQTRLHSSDILRRCGAIALQMPNAALIEVDTVDTTDIKRQKISRILHRTSALATRLCRAFQVWTVARTGPNGLPPFP